MFASALRGWQLKGVRVYRFLLSIAPLFDSKSSQLLIFEFSSFFVLHLPSSNKPYLLYFSFSFVQLICYVVPNIRMHVFPLILFFCITAIFSRLSVSGIALSYPRQVFPAHILLLEQRLPYDIHEYLSACNLF
jgi:hypothetical protein